MFQSSYRFHDRSAESLVKWLEPGGDGSRARLQILGASAWRRMNRSAAPGLLEQELDRALGRLAENPWLGTTASWPRLPTSAA